MTDKHELFAQRLNRYVTAMRNGKPDRIPIRPFAAEFTASHTGYTCQEVHDAPRIAGINELKETLSEARERGARPTGRRGLEERLAKKVLDL